jgi:hypothetical protein
MEATVKKKISYEIQPWHYDDELPQAQKKLEESGFADLWEPVVAKTTQLQIDFDRKTEKIGLPPNFKGMMGFLQQRFNLEKHCQYKTTKSKGGGTHIVIDLPVEVDDTERIAWQAAFGSDGKREALNLLRVKREIKNPILLYMPKDTSGTYEGLAAADAPRRIKSDAD